MRKMIFPSLILLATAACGGGGGGADAAPQFDARPSSVRAVTCPNPGGAADISATLSSYQPPSFTTTVNGIVEFNLTGGHTVNSTTTGEMFSLGLNANGCLQFTAAGTFTFRCVPHGFIGTVIAQ